MRKSMTRSSVLAATAALALLGSGVAAAEGSLGSSGSSGSLASSEGSSGSLGSTGPSPQEPFTFTGWDTCPVEDILNKDPDTGEPMPSPGGCQTVIVKSGTMKLGNLTVDLDPDSMKIAGGNKIIPGSPTTWDFYPKNSGVYANPIIVPGGALGIGSAEDFGLTRITASVEQLGTPVFNLPSVTDMTVKLPIRIKLSNPMLGDNCYIGTTAEPVTLDLKVDPSTGGEAGFIPSGEVGTYFPGFTATATDFAVPGATGCGPLGSLNWAANLRAGLPAATGNSLTTKVDMYSASAWLVYQSQQNP